MIFNVSGGGGTALNFRVVGGTTAPANPAENCIWVNTDTTITSWIFSAEEPSPAEAGMVWFNIGTASPVEFNALKKNGIQVYPLKAQQYISGAWVNKTAKSYQGGAWVDWIVYLYDYGKQPYEWQSRAWLHSSNSNMSAGAPTVAKNADGSVTLTLTVASNKYYTTGVYELVEDFDVTNVDVIEAEIVANTTNVTIALTNRNTAVYSEQRVTYAGAVGTNQKETVTMDVSNVTGKHNVCICLYARTDEVKTVTCTFHKMTAK